MSLRVSAQAHPRCLLLNEPKPVKLVFSRLLVTHNFKHEIDQEDDFMSHFRQNNIFGRNRRLSESSRLEHLTQLQHGQLFSPHLVNKFVSICAKLGFLSLGIQLHSTIIKLGFCSNLYVCSALIDMYGKCGIIRNAQKLFDEMSSRNVVVWNSLIWGYLREECPANSIELFLKMLKMGIPPTTLSILAVVMACSQMEFKELGLQVHGLILKVGFSHNVVLGTVLIDMYSKCWNLRDSRRIFDHMLERNVATWTSMLSSYAKYHQPEEAMVLVREMLHFCVGPNHGTYNSLLRSFSNPDHLVNCKQIHCRIIKEGLDADAYVVVTLVTVYSECGSSLEDFWKLCSYIIEWDQISWNAVIAGLCNLGNGVEALIQFSMMRQAGIQTDFYTFTSILKATGIISSLNEGKQIHGIILKSGHASNLYIQNSLISMYARCGSIFDSKQVFFSMNRHDVISWNSLLSGYAYHGYGKEVVELFEKMRRTEIKPNDSTFLVVLTACSHIGLLDKGLEYFQLMISDHMHEHPKMEHYGAIVDLLSRCGYLHDAESFINCMPMEPGPSVYKTLLSACQVHGNKEISLRTADKLLKLYPDDPAAYVMLSNELKGSCPADAAQVRKLMLDRGIMKAPGFSWI